VIGHKRKPERVKHDEAKQRSQCGYKKQGRHLNASAEETPQVTDEPGAGRNGDQPEIANRICRINPPLRINEGEI